MGFSHFLCASVSLWLEFETCHPSKTRAILKIASFSNRYLNGLDMNDTRFAGRNMTRAIFAAGVWLLLSDGLFAQPGGAPLTLPIAPVCSPPPPEPHTLWTFLGLSHQNLKKCHCCFCGSKLGHMCDSLITPFRVVSGGIVPPLCCHVPTCEELACMNPDNCSLAEIVAAKIRRGEADACKRRAAVRFLGSVDCQYYHEAEEALIAHLRADQNECVRLEAAHVLGNGCCCTPRTLAALQIAVAGTAADGNPPEKSDRVKAAAMDALQSCLSCYAGTPATSEAPLQTPPLEVLPPPAPSPKSPLQLMSFTSTADEKKPPRDVVLEAQRTYAAHVGAAVPERTQAKPARNLLQIVAEASTPQEASKQEIARPKPPERPAPNVQPTPARREIRQPLTPIGLMPIGAVPKE